jgi:hypothetical protein
MIHQIVDNSRRYIERRVVADWCPMRSTEAVWGACLSAPKHSAICAQFEQRIDYFQDVCNAYNS